MSASGQLLDECTRIASWNTRHPAALYDVSEALENLESTIRSYNGGDTGAALDQIQASAKRLLRAVERGLAVLPTGTPWYDEPLQASWGAYRAAAQIGAEINAQRDAAAAFSAVARLLRAGQRAVTRGAKATQAVLDDIQR